MIRYGTLMAPGSGLGFWYQFGQLKGLFSHPTTTTTTKYNTPILPHDVRSIGVSAGALALGLVRSGCTFEDCFKGALKASQEITGNEDGKLSLTSGRSQVLHIVDRWLEYCLPQDIDITSTVRGLHLVTLTSNLQHITLTCATRKNVIGGVIETREDFKDALVAATSIPFLLATKPKIVAGRLKCYDACRYDPAVSHLRISSPPVRSANPAVAIEMYEKGYVSGMKKLNNGLLCRTQCLHELEKELPFSSSSAFRSMKTATFDFKYLRSLIS